MATERQIGSALSRVLLGRRDPEDAKRCELNAYILSKLKRWNAPKSVRGWEAWAKDVRKRLLRDVYFKGLPLGMTRLKPRVVWGKVIETGRGYRIRKVRFEGYPGMWIPSLLYEPTNLRGKVPAVLNPNGHHIGGKAMDYKQARCINLAKRGMLALNTEFIGMGELSMNRDHYRIGHMDLCGVAGVSVFYLAMSRALDLLLSHRHCDPTRVAMTGRSGGGWQTAVLASTDERITTIVPVAGHSPAWQRVGCAEDIGDLEQAPVDLCTVADYDLMTALFAPRPTLLIYNLRDDCCFRSRRTRVSVYNPVRPVYERLGVGDRIAFHENTDPGTHNYEADNRRQLYRWLNTHFGMDTPDGDLPFEDELLSERDLNVGLPQNNASMLTLAQEQADKISHRAIRSKPTISKTRKKIAEIIVLRRNRIRAERVARNNQAEHLRLHLGTDWTVPVTRFRGRGTPTVVIGDGGRKGAAQRVSQLGSSGRPVIAADIYGTGESAYPNGLHMSLSMTGERPLGVMVGQILDVSQWAGKRVDLHATGPVSSFAGLTAAALKPSCFSSLYVDGLVESLKRLIETPVNYLDAVPLFCFGLLKVTDVSQLIDLCEGLPIEWRNRGPVYSAARG